MSLGANDFATYWSDCQFCGVRTNAKVRGCCVRGREFSLQNFCPEDYKYYQHPTWGVGYVDTREHVASGLAAFHYGNECALRAIVCREVLTELPFGGGPLN